MHDTPYIVINICMIIMVLITVKYIIKYRKYEKELGIVIKKTVERYVNAEAVYVKFLEDHFCCKVHYDEFKDMLNHEFVDKLIKVEKVKL